VTRRCWSTRIIGYQLSASPWNKIRSVHGSPRASLFGGLSVIVEELAEVAGGLVLGFLEVRDFRLASRFFPFAFGVGGLLWPAGVGTARPGFGNAWGVEESSTRNCSCDMSMTGLTAVT
jgi:hypothetical protein